jgi:hypothetical protein
MSSCILGQFNLRLDAFLQVKARQLWGSGFYTHDSDLVAVLMHCGYVSNIAGVPVNSVQEMRVILEYQPSQAFYPSVLKNGIRSRAWGLHIDGCCFQVPPPPPPPSPLRRMPSHARPCHNLCGGGRFVEMGM